MWQSRICSWLDSSSLGLHFCKVSPCYCKQCRTTRARTNQIARWIREKSSRELTDEYVLKLFARKYIARKFWVFSWKMRLKTDFFLTDRQVRGPNYSVNCCRLVALIIKIILSDFSSTFVFAFHVTKFAVMNSLFRNVKTINLPVSTTWILP